MTACVLTPYSNRKLVADAAKQYPARIVPFGYVDLDAPDVVQHVEELHTLNYRGLGELEFVKTLHGSRVQAGLRTSESVWMGRVVPHRNCLAEEIR